MSDARSFRSQPKNTFNTVNCQPNGYSFGSEGTHDRVESSD